MCVIAVSQSGKKLPYEWLIDMWYVNNDGGGIAFVEDDQVQVRKGFMTLSSFAKFYEKLPEVPHVLHFRLATHGGVNQKFTHPFRIDQPDDLKTKYRAELVLFHNGTIKDYEQFAKLAGVSKRNSDTYCLAKFLAKLSYNDKIKILRKQSGSRFVVLSPNSIVLIGKFFKKEDFWLSNLTWEDYTFYKSLLKRYNKKELE